ncbi:hypothetical protein JZ751_028180 [Albula glossodonta]|uniref:STEAP3 metalloreductase n=1 Tax=Albula glossodonta TaxID=121402 RepID=A0A8T2PJA7_9TELE|nr:hypothetical protein JZ751_028180 [Albula glossodonta]
MPHGDLKKPLLQRSRDMEPIISEASGLVVGILGTGDFSRSLAARLGNSGHAVVVGSRNPKHSAGLFPESVEVTTQQDAADRADLLFVALFPEHYSTLTSLQGALEGKVLVDVSNADQLNQGRPSNAEQLAGLFPNSHVVKGFNVISAWALLAGPRDGSRQIPICSDSSQGKSTVIQLCRSMGFTPVDAGGLSSARDIEDGPLRLFPSWGGPVLCSVCLFIVFYAYNFVRNVLMPYLSEGENLFYQLPVGMVNTTLPAVALEMLALVYLPGLLAAGLQLWRGTKYSRFPSWLDRWLCVRKQLGLLSFLCAALHAVYSLCLPMRRSARYFVLNAAFRQVKEGIEHSWNEEEVWRMELYLSFGILALGVLSLLAVTSLPSVGNSLNWREFSFVQSRLGYTALTIATLHTLTFGWDRAFQPGSYKFYLPPSFMLELVLPCAVLLGRVGLELPCISQRLARIRRGWESGHQVHFQLPGEVPNGDIPEDISDV